MKQEEKIFTIEIRDTNFDFEQYNLILSSKDKKYESGFTENCVIPRFNINIENKNIFRLLNDKKEEGTIELILMNKSNKILFQKNIILPIEFNDLLFLGEEITVINNSFFPCLLFETLKGFYIYGEIKKEEENDNEKHLSISIFSNKSFEKLNKNEQISNLEALATNLEIFNKELEIQKKLLIQAENNLKSKIDTIKEKYKFNLKVNKIINNIQITREKNQVIEKEILQLKQLKNILENFNKKRTEKIKEMEKVLKDEEKIINKQKNNDFVKITQSNKKSKKYNKILRNYYMKEFSYIFFNKEINNNFIFPSFYSTPSNKLDILTEQNFYKTKSREISNFLGVIINICIFLSKKYDIVIPYIPYYNGSKSKIIDNFGKRQLNLYIENKTNDEGFMNFKISIKYIANMLRSIINFLIKDNQLSNIHYHDLNEYNVYRLFLVLNQIIYEYNK